MSRSRSLPTVSDFARLHKVGACVDYPKAELIERVIVPISPQHRRQSRAKTELGHRPRQALAAPDLGLVALVQVTVALPPRSAPEPDIVLADADADESGHVEAATARLVVGVGESTAGYDLGRKAKFYAAGGIPEYRLVDLSRGKLHRFAEPRSDGEWLRRQDTAPGEPVSALTLPGLTIGTAGLG